MCQLVTLGHPGLTFILNFDIRALWRSALSARCSNVRNLKWRLHLDGTEHFEM